MDESRSTDQDPQTTARLFAILGTMERLELRFGLVAGKGPARGSQLHDDLGREQGKLTWIFALQGWANAQDHVFGWRVMLEAGVQTERAHLSLARSALEGAVTCRWLVDPKATRADRRGRGARMQLQDYIGRGRFERYFPSVDRVTGARSKPAADRAGELRVEMTTLGIPHTMPPSMTQRFEDYSLGGWLYDLLSAYAHGRQWGLSAAKLTAAVPLEGGAGRQACPRSGRRCAHGRCGKRCHQRDE